MIFLDVFYIIHPHYALFQESRPLNNLFQNKEIEMQMADLPLNLNDNTNNIFWAQLEPFDVKGIFSKLITIVRKC